MDGSESHTTCWTSIREAALGNPKEREAFGLLALDPPIRQDDAEGCPQRQLSIGAFWREPEAPWMPLHGGHQNPDQLRNLEGFRSYLHLLARIHLDRKLQGKCALSDIVQQTLIEAYQTEGGFRGQTFAQRAAWLRKLLIHNAAKAVRDLHRQKRDVRREQSLEVALEGSSNRLEAFLDARAASPSEAAAEKERILIVADAVEKLPDAQRDVILLHFVEGLTMAAAGEKLGRTPVACAGLLHRGLKRLRELLRGHAPEI